MSLNVLFVGGTGQISLPCVELALKAGHKVSVFNRGQRDEKLPKGVTSIVGIEMTVQAVGAGMGRSPATVTRWMMRSPT